MDGKKSKPAEPILTRRAIYLWIILTSVAIYPSALTVYLNSTTRVRAVVGTIAFIVGVPLGAFVIYSIVRWTNRRDDSREQQPPSDAP